MILSWLDISSPLNVGIEKLALLFRNWEVRIPNIFTETKYIDLYFLQFLSANIMKMPETDHDRAFYILSES
jgi:hypothetical protein